MFSGYARQIQLHLGWAEQQTLRSLGWRKKKCNFLLNKWTYLGEKQVYHGDKQGLAATGT
jgi:hypothetical protein